MRVKYGADVNIVVPEDSTVDETIEALVEIYPELSDATKTTDDNGDTVLTVAHGKKG